MELKLKTFIVLVGTLIAVTNQIHVASKSNGKLLKFYPISKQQYMSILKLSRQQPTISEARVMQHHRSLADWSSSLHNSWNSLFNYSRPGSNGEVIKGYPICVLKTDELTLRKKRGARQYVEDNYAGLVPTVVYTGSPDYSYYGRPSHSGAPPHHGPPYDNDGEAENEEEDNEYVPDDLDSDVISPVVNCVVVIHRRNKTRTETEEDHNKPAYEYPTYPTYPHYSYRQPQNPSYDYPTYDSNNPLPLPPSHYPYPPPPAYGYPSHFAPEHTPKSRHNQIQSEYSSLNPAADAYYQQMLNEYNRHLNSLYMADAATQVSKRQNDEDSVEYNDDEREH